MKNFGAGYSREARVSAVVFAVVLLVGWILLCYPIVDVILDYPLRRAGESDDYPPLYSLAFYWKCFSRLLMIPVILLYRPYWLGGLAVSIISLCFGLKIRSNYWRAGVAIVVIFGPIFAHALYRIFIIY
jgi:membrane protease YdiL (CAAX protease family)